MPKKKVKVSSNGRDAKTPTGEDTAVKRRDGSESDSRRGDLNGKRTEGVGSREEAIARRLYIDKLASAGIDSGRLSVEILFMLPTEFVHAYRALFNEALSGMNNGKSQGNRDDAESVALTPGISKLRGKKVMIGNRQKAVVNGHWFIRNENAFELKQKLDRKLVGMIGELREERSVRRNGRQCVGDKCRRFLKDDWKFCPECGRENGRI